MRGGPGTADPGRFTCEAFDLFALITLAYDLPPDRVSAPAWTHDARFDIVAKVPDGTTKEQLRLMEQSLLAERFQLKVHSETRTMPVYALVVGKNGPKLKQGTTGTAMSIGVRSEGRRTQMTFTSASMGQLAAQLTHVPEVGRAVLDQTGLTGVYDFQLNLTVPARGSPDADLDATSVFTVIQDQLGLKLESRTAPIAILVVDHAERVPTGN
jgi:uncharacterized protein (TIGR03435 family)